ncbi:hypothetical protein GE061_004365 [Apolygus lucorum]|uniref:Uncharacterized protein n=1 Tax=Apolygus lucorum TaxID=248454 RepID=A0A8S9X0I0_APOLU|nr:hypothetical protein GE061_004365 [Apolygus lucorum]
MLLLPSFPVPQFHEWWNGVFLRRLPPPIGSPFFPPNFKENAQKKLSYRLEEQAENLPNEDACKSKTEFTSEADGEAGIGEDGIQTFGEEENVEKILSYQPKEQVCLLNEKRGQIDHQQTKY